MKLAGVKPTLYYHPGAGGGRVPSSRPSLSGQRQKMLRKRKVKVVKAEAATTKEMTSLHQRAAASEDNADSVHG